MNELRLWKPFVPEPVLAMRRRFGAALTPSYPAEQVRLIAERARRPDDRNYFDFGDGMRLMVLVADRNDGKAWFLHLMSGAMGPGRLGGSVVAGLVTAADVSGHGLSLFAHLAGVTLGSLLAPGGLRLDERNSTERVTHWYGFVGRESE